MTNWIYLGRLHHMGVSWNGGTPKSSILNGCSIIKPSILGTPIWGNPHICPISTHLSQLQVGESVPRSPRRFAVILATAGSGPAHAQSVQYNAQLGGAPNGWKLGSGTENQTCLFEHMVPLNPFNHESQCVDIKAYKSHLGVMHPSQTDPNIWGNIFEYELL